MKMASSCQLRELRQQLHEAGGSEIHRIVHCYHLQQNFR